MNINFPPNINQKAVTKSVSREINSTVCTYLPSDVRITLALPNFKDHHWATIESHTQTQNCD